MNEKTKVLKRIEVSGNELVILNRNVETRMATGPLTQQLIPRLAVEILDDDERAALELLGLPFVSLVVRGQGDDEGQAAAQPEVPGNDER